MLSVALSVSLLKLDVYCHTKWVFFAKSSNIFCHFTSQIAEHVAIDTHNWQTWRDNLTLHHQRFRAEDLVPHLS